MTPWPNKFMEPSPADACESAFAGGGIGFGAAHLVVKPTTEPYSAGNGGGPRHRRRSVQDAWRRTN